MMRAKGPSVAPREMTFLIFSQYSLMATVLKYLKAVSPKDLHSNYIHVIYWALLYKWEHFLRHPSMIPEIIYYLNNKSNQQS